MPPRMQIMVFTILVSHYNQQKGSNHSKYEATEVTKNPPKKTGFSPARKIVSLHSTHHKALSFLIKRFEMKY